MPSTESDQIFSVRQNVELREQYLCYYLSQQYLTFVITAYYIFSDFFIGLFY